MTRLAHYMPDGADSANTEIRRRHALLEETSDWLLGLPASLVTALTQLWMDWADLVGVLPGAHQERLTGTAEERQLADATWRRRAWEAHPELLRELPAEGHEGSERRAAEWMARTGGYPRLLCDIAVCCGYDFEIRTGACADSRERPAAILAAALRAPGALRALLLWLRGVHLARSLPPQWSRVYALAPSPDQAHWTSRIAWQVIGARELVVSVGGFLHQEAALDFGESCSMVWAGEELLIASRGTTPLRLDDHNLCLCELRANPLRLLMWRDTDFVPLPFPPARSLKQGIGESFGGLDYIAVRSTSRSPR